MLALDFLEVEAVEEVEIESKEQVVEEAEVLQWMIEVEIEIKVEGEEDEEIVHQVLEHVAVSVEEVEAEEVNNSFMYSAIKTVSTINFMISLNRA